MDFGEHTALSAHDIPITVLLEWGTHVVNLCLKGKSAIGMIQTYK